MASHERQRATLDKALSNEARKQNGAVGASVFIKVCNPTDDNVDDSFTRFNLLVINAQ